MATCTQRLDGKESAPHAGGSAQQPPSSVATCARLEGGGGAEGSTSRQEGAVRVLNARGALRTLSLHVAHALACEPAACGRLEGERAAAPRAVTRVGLRTRRGEPAFTQHGCAVGRPRQCIDPRVISDIPVPYLRRISILILYLEERKTMDNWPTQTITQGAGTSKEVETFVAKSSLNACGNCRVLWWCHELDMRALKVV